MGFFDDLKEKEDARVTKEKRIEHLNNLIEDLFTDFKTISDQYYNSNKIAEKIEQKGNDLRNEFTTFFEKRNFTVDSNTSEITATYGEVKVILSHDTSGLQEFNLNIPYRDLYNIFITESEEFKYEPKFQGVRLSTNSPLWLRGAKDNEEELEKQVAFLKEDIETIRKRIDNASNVEFVYNLSSKDNGNLGNFSSAEDLLDFINK